MTVNWGSTAVSATPSLFKRTRRLVVAGRQLWRSAVSLLVCGALAGCAGGPSFGELFDESAAGEGTGIQGAALVRAVVILARHQATPRQREVAEQNARRAVAALERQIATERPKTIARKHSTPRTKTAAISKPKKTTAGTKAGTTRKNLPRESPTIPGKKLAATAPAPEPEREPEPEPERAPAPAKPAKKLPARIAIRTVKDEKTVPGAEAAVMIYDVQARRIVGNEVYDIEAEPRSGDTVKFDTNVVRYVGASGY